MIDFSPHAVAYLDILGFKNFIIVAEKNFDKLEKLNNLFNEVIPREILPDGKNSTYSKDFEMKCLSISDSLIVSAPVSENQTHPALVVVTMKAIQIAHALLDMGFLVRGAINIGNVYRTDTNILGTGYQDAVMFGDKSGDPPQIILTDNATVALNKSVKNGMPTYSIFALNELGQTILNAIHPEPSYLPDPQGNITEYFKKYRAVIKENLSSDDKKVKSKWLWFAKLFNANVQYFSTLDSSMAIELDSHGITINYLNTPEENSNWMDRFMAPGRTVIINSNHNKTEQSVETRQGQYQHKGKQ